MNYLLPNYLVSIDISLKYRCNKRKVCFISSYLNWSNVTMYFLGVLITWNSYYSFTYKLIRCWDIFLPFCGRMKIKQGKIRFVKAKQYLHWSDVEKGQGLIQTSVKYNPNCICLKIVLFKFELSNQTIKKHRNITVRNSATTTELEGRRKVIPQE